MEDNYTNNDKTKDERITEEIERLEKLFTKMDKKTKKVAKSLIENAAFMAITLEDLQQHINEHGAVTEYQNGENQKGTKKSPEVDIYIAMVKNHMSITKQLTDLMPPPEVKIKKEEPDEFEKLLERVKYG